MNMLQGKCSRCNGDVEQCQISCPSCGWIEWSDDVLKRDKRVYNRIYDQKYNQSLDEIVCDSADDCCDKPELEVEYNDLCDYCQHIVDKDD